MRRRRRMRRPATGHHPYGAGARGVYRARTTAAGSFDPNAALIVNPYDVKDTGDAIHRGIVMGSRERARRWEGLLNEVRTNTAAAWAEAFLRDLADS